MMPSTIHIFGDFIRQQRKAKGMSQQELSARAFNKPNRPFFNPLLSKDACAYQKTTRNIMEEMRGVIQKSDGYED